MHIRTGEIIPEGELNSRFDKADFVKLDMENQQTELEVRDAVFNNNGKADFNKHRKLKSYANTYKSTIRNPTGKRALRLLKQSNRY